MPKGHKLTQEEFIAKAKSIHGDKYNYSKVIYTHNKSKVTIVCPIHGEFVQAPINHLRGKGCMECAAPLKVSFLSQQEFIVRANKIHCNFFSYEKVIYKDSRLPVEIICPKHGSFFQAPRNHMEGYKGCKQCNHETKIKPKKTPEKFIQEAIKVHQDTYDYSKTVYEHNTKKILIICKKHGEFYQTPSQHLVGRGCPICSESSGEKAIRTFLKTNNIKFTPQKTFPNCKNKILLRFDFYLPKYNLVVEYQGKQHYHSIKYWGGDDNLKRVQQNDTIKKNYCAENGIGYLAIPYTEDPIQKLQEVLSRYGQLLAHTKYSLIF